jgi:hypothetical protein
MEALLYRSSYTLSGDEFVKDRLGDSLTLFVDGKVAQIFVGKPEL